MVRLGAWLPRSEEAAGRDREARSRGPFGDVTA